MNKFEFFGLNLRNLPNYVQCFGSNIVEGVTELCGGSNELGGSGWSWVEFGRGGWSYVEVGARFSNTLQVCVFLTIS